MARGAERAGRQPGGLVAFIVTEPLEAARLHRSGRDAWSANRGVAGRRRRCWCRRAGEVMMVELSEVTCRRWASTIVAVRTRVAPEVRSAVEPARTMSAAAPWIIVNFPSVLVVSPAGVVALSCYRSGDSGAGHGLRRDTARRGGVAGPRDGAGADRLLRECDHRRVVGGRARCSWLCL